MAQDLARLRESLAESVTGNVGPLVADALRTVPRHLFLPGLPPEQVYSDDAIVTKRDADGLPLSSSSQPALMAAMLDQLALAPGHRVLEIGAGTGYNAALIRHIVGPSGLVVSIDIDLDIVEEAREHLATAGYPDVIALCRDGAEGAAEHAPFDRLIATIGLTDLSPAWPAQLGPGARMVVPVEISGPMLSVAFERENGHWASRTTEPCSFIKVRGALAGPTHVIALTEQITLKLPERREIDAAALLTALSDGTVATLRTGIPKGPSVSVWGLYSWLSGAEPLAVALSERLTGGDPGLLGKSPTRGERFRITYGLVSGGSAAVFAVSDDDELTVAGYGADGASLAESLLAAARDWTASGQPGTRGLRVDAYPADAEVPADAGMVLDRPCTRFVIYRA
jgi:protein-L-isoaspartate(D-aspartate) O-methyltransferase